MTEPTPDEIRGDLTNPAVAMERELYGVLDDYPHVTQREPEAAAAILVDLADSIRQLNGLEVEVEHLGGGAHAIRFGDGDMAGLVGVPRSGEYMDVDPERLEEVIEAGGADE